MRAVDIERLVQFTKNFLEVARLQAAIGSSRVAVHRIAAPQHRAAGGLGGSDQSRQMLRDALAAEPVNEREPARLVFRIESRDQPLDTIGRNGGPDFHANGVADAAEVFHVGAIRVGGAHPDPWKMRREIEPALLPRYLACLRLLVRKVQPLVAGEEVDPVEAAGVFAGQVFHEAERFVNSPRRPPVFAGHRRVADPVQVPVVEVMRIDKPAYYQGTNEVDGQSGTLIAAQHEAWVGHSGLGCEVGTIDEIAAIGGQGQAVAGFELLGTRLGILARKAPNAHHALLRAVDQNQAHLQQNFDLVGDRRGVAGIEAFRAIAALQQEALAANSFGQLRLEIQHFPRSDEGWKFGDLLHNPVHLFLAWVIRLLRGWLSLPGIRGPPGHGAARNSPLEVKGPEARSSRIRPRFKPTRLAASVMYRMASGTGVSGSTRKIHGTFVVVSFLSEESAITGRNVLTAICSAKCADARSVATSPSAPLR